MSHDNCCYRVRLTLGTAIAALLLFAGCGEGGGTTAGQPDQAKIGPTCGNGVLDPGEHCDGTAMPQKLCSELGLGNGALLCAASCLYDFSGCSTQSLCGDGVAQGMEECDGTDFDGATCETRGYTGGVLACTANCRLAFAQCTGESDRDGDDVPDVRDNCPDDSNQDQADQDDDDLGDVCDNCPAEANADQADADGDHVGDACEGAADWDGDQVPNEEDNCPRTANSDQTNEDGDDHGDACDNCPGVSNDDQSDSDQDEVGDACEPESITYEFTTCGDTGPFGPQASACESAYLSTTNEGLVTVSSGIQRWAVPTTGRYRIEAWGAQGGTANTTYRGGRGAYVSGEFELTSGEALRLLVGQRGTSGGWDAGGGGGSYVAREDNTPLLVAGGGGGVAWYSGRNGCGGLAGILASAADSACSPKLAIDAGKGGEPPTGSTAGGAGGAGFSDNGKGQISCSYDNCSPLSTGGESFTNGGNGGGGNAYYHSWGGFGGGGGAYRCGYAAGGGGGYSGGDGGLGAGGGGSYNAGQNPSSTADVNPGEGLISIVGPL